MEYINKILHGSALEQLKNLPDKSIDCCVTSPPYWGLRDYGVDGQVGLEDSPEKFIQNLVEIFREVKRALKDGGTCWINIGDSYASHGKNRTEEQARAKSNLNGGFKTQTQILKQPSKLSGDLKAKDLVGIPWMLAFALRADGWYLRQDIIWSKPNPMPESVTDRCSKAHEYVFLLSKSSKYFYDYVSIKTLSSDPLEGSRANKKSVWEVSTKGYKEAHFATFPEKLIVDCIKAGCPKEVCSNCGAPKARVYEKELVPTKKATKTFVVDERDLNADKMDQGSNRQKDGHKSGYINKHTTVGFEQTCNCQAKFIPGMVIDPFMGAGTTGLVARKLGRNYVGIELNAEYIKISENRIIKEIGLFN